ncbi:MAG: hypothetical protein JWN86_2926 [Planctomycetota bacterium]|nr:hypothetical protein [Planctomycetota bacterium]
MIRIAVASVCLTVGLCGCGGGLPESARKSLPSTPGTHGGTAFPLASDKGYVEVVIETVKATKADRDVILAMYFLKPDLKSPLETTPTGVAASFAAPGQEAQIKATLDSRPKAKGDGRFASEVGPYDFDEIHGEITGSLDGQAFTIPFAVK